MLLFLTIPTLLLSQGWEKIYEYGSGQSVQQTLDGGYIIAGWKLSFTSDGYDVYLIKTDENGNTLWDRTFSESGSDMGYSVQQTSDGGYIITGSTGSVFTDYDVYLIKTDDNGSELWTKTYGGTTDDCGKSVQETMDGGYIITGWTLSIGTSYDVYLIKTDENGEIIWTKTYGGNYWDIGNSVQQTIDGGYIITGYTDQIDYDNGDVYLVKTDNNGDTIWTKTFGGQLKDEGYSVQQTFDGGYIITGVTEHSNTKHNVYFIKTDENGETIWTKTFIDEYDSYGYSVQQTTDGGYIITGEISNSTGFDVYLIKMDNDGNTLWTNSYGRYHIDIGYSIKQTTDGGYIITGKTLSANTGLMDVYLIKTDSIGITVSTTEIPFLNPNKRLVKIIDLSGREIIKPIENVPFIEIYNDGTTKNKMNIR